MAKAWGAPPWLIDEQCSAEWAERFFLWQRVEAEMNEVRQGHAQVVGGRFMRRRS
jgi:hypothetical protein